jgi:hypothetical protein
MSDAIYFTFHLYAGAAALLPRHKGPPTCCDDVKVGNRQYSCESSFPVLSGADSLLLASGTISAEESATPRCRHRR